MSANVTLVTSNDRHLEDLLRAVRIEHVTVGEGHLAAIASRATAPDGVLVVDLRGRQHLPPALVALKQQHPGASVVVVTSSMDPTLMLEAMRAGVNEYVAEPLAAKDLETAIAHVATRFGGAVPGTVLAFVGARGGVGTTTVAVNVATELARLSQETLLMDLHAAFGDAVLFVGGEARFTLVDAVENAKRLDQAFFRSLVVRGKDRPDVLASPSRTSLLPLDAAAIRTVVEFATRCYRQVVLDTTLYDPAAPDVLSLAATIAVVTNQELSTVRSAARIVADLRAQYGKDRVTVVINRADRHAEIGVDDVERAVGQRVRHVLDSDYREAIKALNAGTPLTLGSSRRLRAAFKAMARDLADVAEPQPEASGEQERISTFARLVSRRPSVTALGELK